MTLILTPCYDGKLDVRYVDSLINTLRVVPDVFPLWMPGESLLPKARNELFKLAYESPADSVIWIDADEAWQPSDVQKLLDDPHPFVTGLVRQRRDERTYCIRKPEGDHVESCGMGFCKMTREVLIELWEKSAPYTQQAGLSSGFRNVFEIQVIGEELMSEDISACHKWSGTIYFREDILIAHIGTKVYN